MKEETSSRIFLGVVTIIASAAGSGLTLFNHMDFSIFENATRNNVKALLIALTLAASFLNAETVYLWAHKTYDHLVKMKARLARKIVMVVTIGLLCCCMGAALYQELKAVLSGTELNNFASAVATIQQNGIDNASGARERLSATKSAIAAIKDKSDKQEKIIVWPFALCYLVAILGAVAISVCRIHQKARVVSTRPNLIEDPTLGPKIQAASSIGFGTSVKAAYQVKGGVSLYDNAGKYTGFISNRKIQ